MIVTKPPLGWNTWNTFGANINEELLLHSADAMVELGLKDAGYEYIVIDDIWSLKERDANGRLMPHPEKFPHGMKYIADYIHAKGLKFGMYSDAGYLTCAGYPGSYGHEWIDAQTFAEWGVDFLKYDYGYHPQTMQPDVLYKRMGLALRNCGQDIVFSACSWGIDHTRQWIRETGAHCWRSTWDLMDSWDSVKTHAQEQLRYQEYNTYGCFNDMDMLIVGMNNQGNVALGGCTNEEYKLHFSLWALLNSPLMIGCDIRNMTEEAKAILTNKDVIAINQDCACQPFIANAHRWVPRQQRGSNDPFYQHYPDEQIIVAKYLNDGDIAIGFFNLSEHESHHDFDTVLFDTLGLPADGSKKLELTDLWTGETFTSYHGTVPAGPLKPHTCRLVRAKVVD